MTYLNDNCKFDLMIQIDKKQLLQPYAKGFNYLIVQIFDYDT